MEQELLSRAYVQTPVLYTVYRILHFIIFSVSTPTHKIQNTVVDAKVVRECIMHSCTGYQFKFWSILIFTSSQMLENTAHYMWQLIPATYKMRSSCAEWVLYSAAIRTLKALI